MYSIRNLVTAFLVIPEMSHAPGSAGAWGTQLLACMMIGFSFIPLILLNLIVFATIGKNTRIKG